MLPVYILITIFLVSFITNILPFAGAPYTIIATDFLILYGKSLVNIVLVIILSGIGAAIAKILTYYLGVLLRKPLKKNKNIPLLERFLNTKYFPLALFITAILPGLPLDDYLYIGGGVGKKSLLHMLTITIPSKILKSSIEIPLELLGIIKISNYTGISAVTLSLIFTIIFVIIGIVLIKIDWNPIYEKIEKYLNKK